MSENDIDFDAKTEIEPTDLVIQAETQDEYVLGAPVHINLTLKCEKKNTIFRLLPYFGIFSLPSELGLELLDSSGNTITEVTPFLNYNRIEKLGGFDLGYAEARRSLIDISAFLPEELKPDTYQIGIDLATPTVVSTQFVPLRIRPPHERELSMLAPYASQVSDAGSWSEWTLEPVVPEELETPIERDDLLRFNKVLRLLLHSTTPWDELDLCLLDALDGIYEAEALVLRSELLLVRGTISEALDVEQQAVAKFTGLEWRFAEFTEGESTLANLRRLGHQK